jgi:predicted exporter
MSKFFYNCHVFLKQNKSLFTIILVALLVVLGFLASRLHFAEDISKLIPQNETNQTLQKVLNAANFSDKIIVHIKKEQDVSTEELTNYAEEFFDELNENQQKYIERIQGYIEEESVFESLDFVYNNLPFFLTETDYKNISQKINPDSIAKITKSNYQTLISPYGFVAKETIIKDPLGLSVLGINHLKSLGFNKDFKIVNGFLVNQKETDLLLFITPKFPTSETQENTVFSEQLYQLQNQLNQKYTTKISASYFGGVLIAVANANQIKQDVLLTVSIALATLLIVFVVFYRSILVPFIIIIPTIYGALIALVLLSVFRTSISAISLGVGSVLLGITLDYSLHILTHLRAKHSIKNTLEQVAKPIIMSSVTTALAFFCLLFINSDALQDLGLFSGFSVLFSALFALILIPLLFKSNTKNNEIKKTRIDQFATYAFHKNKFMLAGLLGLVIGSFFYYSEIQFNKDLSSLNFVPKQLQQAEKDLETLANNADKTIYAVSFGNTLEDALQTNDALFLKLEQAKENQALENFTSVAPLAKSNAKQDALLDKWQSFFNEERANQLKNELIKSGQLVGFKPETHQEFYTLFQNNFQPIALDSLKAISSISVNDFIGSKDNFHTITTAVNLKEAQIGPFKTQFKHKKNIILIDRQAINEDLLGTLQQNFNTLILYSFGAVILVLFVFYRRLKLVVVTVIPIAVTWLITIGLLSFLDIPFNVFNIIISTFIFGLGIDYSIFITNGLEKASQLNKQLLPTYKTSVILSVITTLLGVGILFLAKHPALKSLALVSVIGITTAMLVSFTLQPLIYKLLSSTKN